MDFTRPLNTRPPAPNDLSQYVIREREMSRILAFARRSIDDVVNDPMAKREVYNWFKTDRRLRRAIEVHDLERQWNGLR